MNIKLSFLPIVWIDVSLQFITLTYKIKFDNAFNVTDINVFTYIKLDILEWYLLFPLFISAHIVGYLHGSMVLLNCIYVMYHNIIEISLIHLWISLIHVFKSSCIWVFVYLNIISLS